MQPSHVSGITDVQPSSGKLLAFGNCTMFNGKDLLVPRKSMFSAEHLCYVQITLKNFGSNLEMDKASMQRIHNW